MILDHIDYLKLIRPYYIFNTCLFLLAILSGYVVASNNPQLVENIIFQFDESYGWLVDESLIVLMLFIFLNNTLICFAGLLLGVFFGICPILLILINGTVIGIISYKAINQYGGLILLAAMAPHGIIEIPMVLLSTSIGLRLGVLTAQKLFTIKDISIKLEVLNAVRFFIILIVPLLFIAAFIETFITSIIVNILLLFY
jgi:stage II sporulation protein M